MLKSPLSFWAKRQTGKIQDFVDTAIRDFKHVGGIFPSTPWAAAAIARNLPPNAMAVAEYGPANGTVSTGLLERLPNEARLVGIEVNGHFADQLKTEVPDKRLEVIHGDVIEYSQKLKTLSPEGFDAVVSGIPFTFLSYSDRDRIVAATRDGLKPGGRFIVYQNSPRMMPILRKSFDDVFCVFEVRNVFPYFIMVATKR